LWGDAHMETNVVILGDCLDVLRGLPDNSIDSVVTDPPYGLSKEPDIEEVLTKWMAGEDYEHRGGGFMGKTWDSFVPGPAIWREVCRVLKPGGHALVFAGTRTQDLMTVSLRLAGFEIRDCIAYLYFSGFPKSLDVSKAFDKRAGVEREVIREYVAPDGNPRTNGTHFSAGEIGGKRPKKDYLTAPATPLAKKWNGWGTALKPAHEPIIMARKPLIGTVAENVERFGTGAINIDACRIGDEKITTNGRGNMSGVTPIVPQSAEYAGSTHTGRFPANCVTTEPDAFFSKYFNVTPPELSKKASRKDRNSDWKGSEIKVEGKLPKHVFGDGFNSATKVRKDGDEEAIRNGELPEGRTLLKNNHPTVKPTDLMAWLVRLVTPPGGIVLDPFAGSGSTLVAAKREGFQYIGIEREAEYVEIAKARVG
jgi:DNA modification methylase